ERVGAEPSPEEIQAESERIRAAQGLFTEADTERWLRANALDLAGFSALARDEVLVRRFRRAARRLARAQLVSSLALRRAEDVGPTALRPGRRGRGARVPGGAAKTRRQRGA